MSAKSNFKCSECDYTSPRYFGLCPRCKEGTGVEFEAPPTVPGSGIIKKPSRPQFIEESATKSGIDELDTVLSEQGGFVEGQVISLGALPGTGKSTITTQLAKHLEVLYVSAEETHNQVSKRAQRLGVFDKISILSASDYGSIIAAARDEEYDLLVVDSVQAIEESFLAYSKAIQYTSELTQIVKARGKFAILINQVTKSGEITGHNSIQHITDTVLSMESIGDQVLISSVKNRFGTVGEILVLEHEADGLKVAKQNRIDEVLESGVVVINELFGKHHRPVTIECLAVKTSSLNPMRKSVNINNNRVFTLAAVITKSGLNMGNQDIFINSSIPLLPSQSTDLALALAIIGSTLDAQFSSVAGKLSITGKVTNGKVTFKNREIQFGSLHQLIKEIK